MGEVLFLPKEIVQIEESNWERSLLNSIYHIKKWWGESPVLACQRLY